MTSVRSEDSSNFDEKEQESNFLLYMFMLAYLVAMIAVGVAAYRRKRKALDEQADLKSHFGGDFSPVLLSLTTFSSVFSGYTVMGVPQDAATNGFYSLRWLPGILSIVAGMILFYPRIRRLSEVREYRSPMDFITDRFRSPVLTVLGSCCACFPQLIYLTVQVESFTSLLRGVTYELMPAWLCAFIFAFIILGMEKLGGMNSVVLSDAVQAVLMIAGFLLFFCVITYRYGTLNDIGPVDCSSLGFVSQASIESLRSAGELSADPSLCPAEDAGSPSCLPFGCIAAAKPQWVKHLSGSQRGGFFWFVLNLVVFPLNPHMLQRVYVASSDGAVKLVMFVMTVSPFLTMIPGIVAGIVKGTFQDSWPIDDQDASAFAAVGNQLRKNGLFDYILVSMLTCSALAAIMSTADSVILGVSNTLCIDIFKGLVQPSASDQSVVKFGEFVSLLMVALAVVVSLFFISSADFSDLLTIQNGIMMQVAPSFLLGLYSNVSAQATLSGMAAGIISVLVALRYNPLESLEVPAPDFGAMVNLTVLVFVEALQLIPAARAVLERCLSRILAWDCSARETSFGQDRFGDPMSSESIRQSMTGSAEPNSLLLALFFATVLSTVPWWGFILLDVELMWGWPVWGVFSLALTLAAALLSILTICTWRPSRSTCDGLEAYTNPVRRLVTEPDEEGSSSSSSDE